MSDILPEDGAWSQMGRTRRIDVVSEADVLPLVGLWEGYLMARMAVLAMQLGEWTTSLFLRARDNCAISRVGCQCARRLHAPSRN